MRSHQQSQKPASKSAEIDPLLRTRPFAPQKKPASKMEARSSYNLLERPLFPIQTKLTIGAVGDKYEQEADRVAAQVVQQINAPTGSRNDAAVQRIEAPEEENEELQMKPMLQCQTDRGSTAVTPELESSIQRSRGNGQPLASAVRKPMEQAFGADFSRVRVHTNSQADVLSRSIQAKAFTTGQDVFFRQGAYEPGSRGGQELIAHELTHVVQQNGNALARKPQKQDGHGVELQLRDNQSERITTATKPREMSIQRVKDVTISHGGMCGPAALLPILQAEGKADSAHTVADVVNIVKAQGSVVGEILTQPMMTNVLKAYGLGAKYHSFNNTRSLWKALRKTGTNPTLMGISNVGFDGLKRPMDQDLINTARKWVRAHWIIITDMQRLPHKNRRRVTYTESQQRSKKEVSIHEVEDANQNVQSLNGWNWNQWSTAYGRDPKVDPDVKEAENQGRLTPSGEAVEPLSLDGYLVEIS
jgi:hypothetical protein